MSLVTWCIHVPLLLNIYDLVVVIDVVPLTFCPDYAFLEGPIAALTTNYDYYGGKHKEKGVKATQGMRTFERGTLAEC